MNYLWLALGGGGLFLCGLLSWRYAVLGALLLAVLEGAIRKWILPEASQMVYFAKDFLLLGAYGSFFFGAGKKPSLRLPEILSFLLGASVVWTFLESFNPGTGSLLAGFFGWKAYVIYLPLLFIVPSLFQSERDFERFLRWYVAIALPVCLLGWAQFRAGPDSPLNAYAPGVGGTGETGNIATFGEDSFVRVTGTFSYISGYSSYLVVMLALLVPLLAWSSTLFWQFFFCVTLCLVIGNVMMTGSRSTALGAAIILSGFAFITPLTGVPGERKRVWVHWLAGAAAIIAAFALFEDAINSLEQRTESGWEEGKGRVWAAVLEPWDYLGEAGLFGFGAGISQPAVSALRTALHLPPPVSEYSSPTDAENSRVMMELGVPGFLLWYGLRLYLLFALWQTRRRLQSPFLRQMALGSFLVLFFQLFTTTMFAHTANIYHWFLAGFILLFPRLDSAQISTPAPASRKERKRRRTPLAPTPEYR